MHRITNITITPEILKLIADIDEFKGRWTVFETVAPEKTHHSSTYCHNRERGVVHSYPRGRSSAMRRWRSYSPGCIPNHLVAAPRRK